MPSNLPYLIADFSRRVLTRKRGPTIYLLALDGSGC
jgi:hypothetical protein